MKILVTGDWHLTDIAPARRIDGYAEAIFDKLHQLGDIALDTGCSTILQPGDFFDAFRVSESLKTRVIELLVIWRNQGLNVSTIPGQHDMRYRDFDLSNTSLGVVKAAGALLVLPLLGESGTQWLITTEEQDRPAELVQIFGAPYGAEIPEIINQTTSTFNILLVHKMITKKGPLWPGQTDYISGRAMLKKHPYDLIVAGDNHKSFYVDHGDRSLINCGSLMRSSIAQVEHEPCVWVYDTVTRLKTCHDLEIKRSSEVFDSVKIEDREIDVFLDGANEFFEGIQGVEEHEFDYFEMVDQFVQGNKDDISEDTQEVVKEVIQAIIEQSTGV